VSDDLQPLLEDLVRRPSVTPDDAGCQDVLADRLRPLGFEIEHLDFDDTRNLWARRGTDGPLLCLLGHTDVVAPGPLEEWSSPPFEPSIRDGVMYGRGTADMKGSLAAMVVALERFLAPGATPRGSIALLITSDEEGRAVNGTERALKTLVERGEQIDWCLVGEPSSLESLGDVMKVGRRGSMRGELTVHGIQGHTAYPHLAENPVHRLAPVLVELCSTHWDDGNAHFPPTTFQVSNIQAGTGSTNVIPGALRMSFNFRFGTASPSAALRERVEAVLQSHDLRYTLEWKVAGEPFLTTGGSLIEAVTAAVEAETGRSPREDTGGGTSDGRFVAPLGAEVVELGPRNASIHKVDEHVRLADLDALARIYAGVLGRLLG
jgi:succinyl-diaminopimelate desuccinylase